jgi:hypothetical protein
VFKRRRVEGYDDLARVLQRRLDAQSRELHALSDALKSLTVETAAGTRESRALELLIATQLDMLRDRLSAVTEVCERLGDRIEIDRLDRRRLTDALVEIAGRQSNEPTPGRRAVGVTVFAIDDDVDVEPRALAGLVKSLEAGDEVGGDFRRAR